MAQLNTDLETLKTARDNMKTALEGKGQTVTKDIRTYAQAIANISGGGSGDIKLFDTVEHMQQDPNPQEGDLAVVYREEIQPVTEESEFDSCTFPNTVVLDKAFSSNINGSFRAVDQSVMFDSMIDMSSSSFRFDGYGDSGEIRVQYTSNDGITYTRTDGGEELQEFGTVIKYELYEPWNDVIGKFMKIGGNYFEGLYEYRVDNVDKEHFSFIPLSDISVEYENNIFTAELNTNYNQVGMYSISALNELYTKMYDELSPTLRDFYIWMSNNSIHGTFLDNPPRLLYALNNNTLNVYGMSVTAKSDSLKDYILDLDNGTYTLNSEISWEYDISDPSPYTSVHTFELPIDTVIIRVSSNLPNLISPETTFVSFNLQSPPDSMKSSIIQKPIINYRYDAYISASTQLDATSDYVYEKTFYGKNGVEAGTLVTNISNSFADMNAEIVYKIKQQYDNMQPRVLTDQDKTIDRNIYFIPVKSDGTLLLDTSNVTNMYNMFAMCSNLTTIPAIDTSNATDMSCMFAQDKNLLEIPMLDTSNVTGMYCMFVNCTNLTTVPQLDTSNLEDGVQYINSGVQDMFASCSSLSNESLNNILAMCTNAIKLTTNKTLAYMGLTSEQATICQGLSNYSAFIAAGWTTGY